MIGKPLFSNLFGENNLIKVLDFFFMGKDFDFTLTQISNGTGLSRTAVRNAIEYFQKENITILSRTDNKSNYYKINRNNCKFHVLEQLYKMIKQEVILA